MVTLDILYTVVMCNSFNCRNLSTSHSTLRVSKLAQKNFPNILFSWMSSECVYFLRQSWALSVFFSSFNNLKCFFCIFYKVDNLFMHQSYSKSPLSVKLPSQKCKKSFFIIEKIKKYRKCPALSKIIFTCK